ncbi:hypothetical protein BJ508DRAFT_337009, partial [Ascobolus immersus RN42]
MADQVEIFEDARETQDTDHAAASLLVHFGMSGALQTAQTSGQTKMTQSLLNGCAGFQKAVGTKTTFGKANTEYKVSKEPKKKKKASSGVVRAKTSTPGYIKEGSMEPNVYKVYRALKFKVHEIMYSVNPYMSFVALGEEMEKHWINQLAIEGKGLTLANTPYTPLPLSGFQKQYARLKSMLLGEAVKMVGQYYDISVSDKALGQLDPERLMFIRDNCRFTYLNPDGDSPEDTLRYYNTAISRLIIDCVIGKLGVTREFIISWASPSMICFLYTIMFWALTKRFPGKGNIQVEEHHAKPVYLAHMAAFKRLYPEPYMQQGVISHFLETIDRAREDSPTMREGVKVPDSDGFTLEDRR